MDGPVATMEVDTPAQGGGGGGCNNGVCSNIKTHIEDLYSNEPKKCYRGVVEVKFAVIGSPRAKASVIEQGCVARLLQVMRAPDSGLRLKTEVVTVLNSLAKGRPEHAASLVQAGVLPVLWEQLEACGHCNILNNASQYVIKVTFNGNDNANGNANNTTNDNDAINLSNNSSSTSSSNISRNDNANNNSNIKSSIDDTNSTNNTSSSTTITTTSSTTNNLNVSQHNNQSNNNQNNHKLMRIISNYTQMLLCCLRSVYRQGCVPPPPSWNPKLLSTLIQYGYHPPTNQECVANILAYACKTPSALSPAVSSQTSETTSSQATQTTECCEQQQQLVGAGGGRLVAAMLCSPLIRVQLPALHCLAALARNNRVVSEQLCSISHGGVTVADRLVLLLGSHGEPAVQLAAATALVCLHRGHALAHSDTRICNKTLQCLVRLCKSDRAAWLRVEAARGLATLTELSPELQRIAASTDHLIPTLRDFLDYKPLEGLASDGGAIPAVCAPPRPEHLSPSSCGQFDETALLPELMRESGLLVYASLAANSEDIRQKVIAAPTLLETITSTLASGSPAVQLSAIRCLHSLSRSVHTLRTTFQDHLVWKPLLALVQDTKADDEMVVVALSTLCNLILEFSPSKEQILEQGCISQLCLLTRKTHYDLRLNAVWALMNIAFQADCAVKESILNQLGTDQIFRLLSDKDVAIVMKTLGMLRNLLSNKLHIDTIMRDHGKEVMQAIILTLEGEHGSGVKEQALCILANIADGSHAKEAIMSNEDVLKKLFNYMVIPTVVLQLAATCCIGNLAAADEPGASDRQARLRQMNVERLLDTLLSTTDPNLFDKVKHALDQFKLHNSSSSSSSSSTSASNGSSSASSTPASHWRPLDHGQ